MSVTKERKVINGTNITLMKKSGDICTEFIYNQELFYNQLEQKLKTYVDTKAFISKTSETVETKEIDDTTGEEILVRETTTTLDIPEISITTILDIISNSPEHGNYLSFNADINGLAWQQFPTFDIPEIIDYQPQIDQINSRINKHDQAILYITNTLTSYRNEFTTYHLETSNIQVPFANGQGDYGIFWLDLNLDPIDNYSIKMGRDNESNGETGYSHDWTFATIVNGYAGYSGYTPRTLRTTCTSTYGFFDTERTYDIDNNIAMRFSNGSELGRGWVWTRWGSTWGSSRSEIPVMGLSNVGVLTTEHCIVSNRYGSILGQESNDNLGTGTTLDVLGAFHVVGYEQSAATGWSGDSIITISNSDLSTNYDGYVLAYEDSYYRGEEKFIEFPGSFTGYNPHIGHIRLKKNISPESTGFVNYGNDATLSMVGRDFEISPTGSSFVFYIGGKEYTKTVTQDIQITDDEGLHYIVFSASDGTLASFTGHNDTSFIEDNCSVAIVYWDKENQELVGVDRETHGYKMNGRTHHYLHDTFGAQYDSGFSLWGINADESGDDDQHAVVGVEAGEFWDEDLKFEYDQVDTGATIPIVYLSGTTGNWRNAPDGLRIHPVITGGTGRMMWNEWTGSLWKLTELTNNDYMCMHFFATTSTGSSTIAIPGQTDYTNLSSARAGAPDEIASLVTSGLPSKEFIPIGTVIFNSNDGYANQSKAKIVSDGEGNDWIDFRTSKISSVSNINDHGNLGGLSDDDHTQYHNDTRAEAWLTGNSHITISASTFSGITHTKSITVPSVTNSEDITLMYVDRACTMKQLNVVLSGSSPSVYWWVKSAADRSAAGKVIASATSTSITTGDEYTTAPNLVDAALPASSWLWFETTVTGGTAVNQFHLTFQYQEN